MKLENIDLRAGTIVYNEFCIDPKIPIQKQMIDWDEDLIQIEYPQNYVLDLGWYHGLNGRFVICVIKDHDWENPMLVKETRGISRLEHYMQQAIDFIAQSIDNKNLAPSATISCNFNRSEFLSFFDEEYLTDNESGAFRYLIKLEHDFELDVNILVIDKFVSIRLDQEILKLKIFDIGFEEITYLKLYKREDLDYVALDLYKNTLPNNKDSESQEHFIRITIKPSVSVTLNIP